jgi:hypothetical protein
MQCVVLTRRGCTTPAALHRDPRTRRRRYTARRRVHMPPCPCPAPTIPRFYGSAQSVCLLGACSKQKSLGDALWVAIPYLPAAIHSGLRTLTGASDSNHTVATPGYISANRPPLRTKAAYRASSVPEQDSDDAASTAWPPQSWRPPRSPQRVTHPDPKRQPLTFKIACPSDHLCIRQSIRHPRTKSCVLPQTRGPFSRTHTHALAHAQPQPRLCHGDTVRNPTLHMSPRSLARTAVALPEAWRIRFRARLQPGHVLLPASPGSAQKRSGALGQRPQGLPLLVV